MLWFCFIYFNYKMVVNFDFHFYYLRIKKDTLINKKRQLFGLASVEKFSSDTNLYDILYKPSYRNKVFWDIL